MRHERSLPARRRALLLAGLLIGSALQHAIAAPLDDAASAYRYIHVERQGAVLVARFYNPPTNLMNAAMVDELRDLLGNVAADQQTRVLIFTGGVAGVFIKHYDMGEIKTFADAAAMDSSIGSESQLKPIHLALLAIEALPKPVIAAINGETGGGGLELALACDFRLMTDPGTLAFPEIYAGFVPGAGGTVRLPRLVGIARAKQIIMLGQPVDAAEAVRDGLVMEAVPPDQLMPAAMKLAEHLASLPPAALAMAKKLINTSGELPPRDALLQEQRSFWTLLRTEDAQQRIRKFFASPPGGAAVPATGQK